MGRNNASMHHEIGKRLVPADGISILNAVFGFSALLVLSLYFIDQYIMYRLAFIFILLAMLADGADGMIARRTKKGVLGPYLESMGDITSSGIATGLFIFHMYHPLFYQQSLVVTIGFIGVLIFYVICCLLRLSAFHPLQTTDHYLGLPVPSAALLLLCCSYISIPFIVCIMMVLVTSLLMISMIHYMKPSMKVNVIAATAIFLVIIFDTWYHNVFIWVLIAIIGIYIIFGPFVYRKTIGSGF